MRWRPFFIVSLAGNVALGAAWFVASRSHSASAGPEADSTTLVKTNVIVRRQYFSWAEVESSDYPTYVANLREIGCPAQTIRDIIIADVNAMYARRLALEVVTPDQQWWRVEPDPEVVSAAIETVRRLEEERRALLARLLGPDWEARDLAGLPRPSRPGVPLDGPVLGALPEETKQALQNISSRAVDRLQAYLDAQRQLGKAPDPVELAKLRQQTRDELTRLLTPPQVEEYLLRYSQNAKDLRAELAQLKYLGASSDEFRSIFRATDSVDQKLQLLAGSDDPNSVAQRNALLQQREDAIKLALGANRYQLYVQLRDPAYRDAYAAAQDAGDPDAAQTLYEIKLASAQQMAAIRANTNMTTQQREIELKRTELQQLQANAQALGQDVPAMDTPAPPPDNTPPAPPPQRTRPYVLGIGESAASVARLYGLPMAAIATANPGVNLGRLKAGDTILVPDAVPEM